MYYYYSEANEWATGVLIGTIVGSIIGIVICGFICKTINERKGYQGGFAWGFLGVIGIVVVAVRQDNPNRFLNTPQRTMQDVNYMNQQIINNGGWRCFRCGAANYAHTGTCGCGTTKEDSFACWRNYSQRQPQQQMYPQQQMQPQQQNQPQQGYPESQFPDQ